MLRYAERRRVIAEYVAARTGTRPDDLVPQVAGHVSLALSRSAYEHWLAQDRGDLLVHIDAAMNGLRDYFTQ